MRGQPPTVIESTTTCPSCDTECPGAARFCWLCGAPLDTVSSAKPQPPAKPFAASAWSAANQIGALLTLFIVGVVVIGVFVEAPGIGILLGVVLAIATVGICSPRSKMARPKSGVIAAKDVDAGAAGHAARRESNLVLKIVVAALSSIIAALLSFIVVVILSLLSLAAAIASFFESCAELLDKAS